MGVTSHHENPRVIKRLRGGGILAALQIGALKWSSEKAYFQCDGSGLVGIYGGGNLLAKAESRIESFLGICLATRILSYRRDVSDPEIKSSWTVHRSENDVNVPFTRFEMSSEILDVLRHVRSFEFNKDYPMKSRGPWLTSSLGRVNKIFEHDLSENFVLASKWYFDSFKGSDDMLRYVRLITTLEILLGERADTSKSSLGEILGNRLAYLIGKSHKDRSIVMDDFRKIYGVRSKILHHGKHRLKGEERYYISRLVEFCQKALERESELLLAT